MALDELIKFSHLVFQQSDAYPFLTQHKLYHAFCGFESVNKHIKKDYENTF